MRGLLHHLLLTLRLNFRSPMPVIYGYLVPVLFLIGFAAVFRAAQPPLVHELGQLLTITILGGACFGMPTAMVAERERGVWRRYRLLPSATAALVVSTMVARLILVASGALMQVLLAMWIYKMPPPGHPVQLVFAFIFVAWAFLGIGLVIAMLADTVPAVQALGQAIFLPMILIGGIGVPLTALPGWAQIIAGFLPGKYAVAAMDSTVSGSGLGAAAFSVLALIVIGAAAIAASTNMFRWDTGQKLTGRRWILAALAAWAAGGLTAMGTGRTNIVAPAASDDITSQQIDAITYDDLQDDSSPVTPIVHSLDDLSPDIQQWTASFKTRLAQWPPAQDPDPRRRTINLLSLAAVADLDQYQYEGEIPVVVFQQLRDQIPADQLKQILARIILHPPDDVLTSAADLGIPDQPERQDVTNRVVQYAKKLLGRLLGKLAW